MGNYEMIYRSFSMSTEPHLGKALSDVITFTFGCVEFVTLMVISNTLK